MASPARSISTSPGTNYLMQRRSDFEVSEVARGCTSEGEDGLAVDRRRSVAVLSSAATLPARREDLDPADRDTYDVWARWVGAFYSSLAVLLLLALLVGAHMPVDRKVLPDSPTFERSSLSVPPPRSIGK